MNDPLRRKMGMVRGAKGIIRMGGVPGMVNMRKEVRGDRGRECELKRRKCLRTVNNMGIKGNAIISPIGDKRDVRRREKRELMSKVAEG